MIHEKRGDGDAIALVHDTLIFDLGCLKLDAARRQVFQQIAPDMGVRGECIGDQGGEVGRTRRLIDVLSGAPDR